MHNIREPRYRLRSVCLSALIIAFGCGDDDGMAIEHGRDAGPLDAATDSQVAYAGACSDSRVDVVRLAAWPGGGLQLALSAAEADGTPRDALSAGDFSLQREDGTRVELELRAHSESSGVTALLVVPSADAAQHALRLSAARVLVEALPAQERIAVFVLAPGLPLAAELSDRHEHVLARLAAIEPALASATPSLASGVDLATARLAGVSAAWGPLSRTLVVVGAALPDAQLERDAIDAGAEGPGAGEAAQGGVLKAALDTTEGDPMLAARALVDRIAARRAATVLLGACGPFTVAEPLLLQLGSTRCTLQAPAPIAELAGQACVAGEAALDAYPFLDQIDLVLSPEQLAIHDAFGAKQSEADFALQVVLGSGEHATTPIEASAHFRGQTSLECARKSYSINLKGSRARRIAPGIAGDEFYLISMCKEPAYFRQVIASRMMQTVGLFPLDQRYVRLRVAGRERGVYLLLEKPTDTLVADNLALKAVVRRRLDATHEAPEVKFPDPPDAAAALVRYKALAATLNEAEPDQLAAALDAQLDLDGYLRWLAINSYLHNGDSSDEAFFYASDESGTPGAGWYFRHVAWDGDDLFKTCHHSGSYAHADPGGLSYCAESDLDRALMLSPVVYERYVGLLQDLIGERLTEAAVGALLDQTRSELFAQLQDDAVCAAMEELIAQQPEGVHCAQARAYIDSEMNAFRDDLHLRAQELQTAIDAWRAQP